MNDTTNGRHMDPTAGSGSLLVKVARILHNAATQQTQIRQCDKHSFSFVTCNTRDSVIIRPSMVSEQVIDAIAPLVRSGGGSLLNFAFSAQQYEGTASLDFRVRDIQASFGMLCFEPDKSKEWWQNLSKSYEHFRTYQISAGQELSLTPPTAPWLGVILLSPASLLTPLELIELADFEKCVAMTILKRGFA